MSSIVIAGILILVIVLVCLVLVSINNNHRKKMAIELASRFTEMGERNNLSFTHREMMKNFIIGLDELRRKVFILRKKDNKYDFQVIDLREAKSCSKKRLYNSINMGTIEKERYEKHIDKIVLELNYTDNRVPIQICFFEANVNHLLEMSELEQKAEGWATILTQTLNSKLKNTA
jgi:uncharacterized protein YpmB